MSHEPLLFPDPTVDRRQASTCTSPSGSKTAVNGDSKPELASTTSTGARERRKVPTQRASLHHQRSTGKASQLFGLVTTLLYGRGQLGLTLEELHERIAQQRPGTPLSSITQPLMDARLAGFAVKTHRSREGHAGRANRIFVHRSHWQQDDGADHVNDAPGNRDNLRRIVENGYPIYGGAVPREYEHWIERNEA